MVCVKNGHFKHSFTNLARVCATFFYFFDSCGYLLAIAIKQVEKANDLVHPHRTSFDVTPYYNDLCVS